MKKKWFIKTCCLMLAFVMMFSLAGCSKEGENQKTKTTSLDKEHVYRAEAIDLPVELMDVQMLSYKNERIYAIGSNYSENGTTQSYLCSFKLDGSDSTYTQLKTGYETDIEEVNEDVEVGVLESEIVAENVAVEEPVLYTGDASNNEVVNIWFSNYLIDSNCKIYGLGEIYKNFVDEDGFSVDESSSVVFCWDEEGKLLWEKNLSKEFPDEENLYLGSAFFDENDLLWIVLGESGICSINSEAVLEKKQMPPEMINGTIFKGKDDKLFFVNWNDDYTKQFIYTLDVKTMALGEQKEITNVFSNGMVQDEGQIFDFTVLGTNELFGYNYGDEKQTEIMDFIDSDLMTDIQEIVMIDDTHFIAAYREPSKEFPEITCFTKVPAEEVKDKTSIVLAGMYIDWETKQRVIEFNKTNPTYRIQLKEYQTYATAEDYMGGYTKMNNDIIAGEIPDIMLVDDAMPFDSYVSKGLIADLYSFMESDPEIKKEDFLENIFDAYSIDGKLYQLVSAFHVNSVLGKKSKVGDRAGWNMDEFNQVMDSLPDDVIAFSNDMTRDTVLYMAMSMTLDEYIDKETGECSFDSDDFIQILELANLYPKEISSDVYEDESHWEELQNACRNDKALLSELYMSDYMAIKREEVSRFGEEVSIIGFPSKGKNGHTVRTNSTTSYAISAKSNVKEGSWEFIRYYLTDEYQAKVNKMQGMFPVKKSALEILEKESTEKPYWMNEETGEKEYYDNTVWVDGVDVIIEPLTLEEASEVTKFLTSINLRSKIDPKIMDIITEEANVYFEGQKTAEDVATIIQSRVQIYISENR